MRRKGQKAQNLVSVVSAGSDTLKPGDIVFWCNYKVTQSEPKYEKHYVSHVMIHTHIHQNRDEYPIPYFAHATFYTVGRKEKRTRVYKVESGILKPKFNYLVIRCHDKKLAQYAAEIATTLTQMNLTYDMERFEQMNTYLEQVDSLETALSDNRERYEQRAFLQPWKYWLRLHFFKRMFHQQSQRGLRCDQFVMLCYQMARCQQWLKEFEHLTIHSKIAFWPSLNAENSTTEDDGNAYLAEDQDRFEIFTASAKATTSHPQNDSKPLACAFKPNITCDDLKLNLYQHSKQQLPYSSKTYSSPAILLKFLLDEYMTDGGTPEATPLFSLQGLMGSQSIPRDREHPILPSEIVQVPSKELKRKTTKADIQPIECRIRPTYRINTSVAQINPSNHTARIMSSQQERELFAPEHIDPFMGEALRQALHTMVSQKQQRRLNISRNQRHNVRAVAVAIAHSAQSFFQSAPARKKRKKVRRVQVARR